MENIYVMSLDKTGFILSNGKTFEFPFEMEELPTVEKFNEFYQTWKQLIYTDPSKLKKLIEKIKE